jgi:anti-sigma factor RsiW
MKFQDVEHLSAFLDGQLSPAEAERIEARLAADASLRKAQDDLRVARGLLRRTPRLRAPRNFTLSPLNARVRAPQPRSVPLLRYAGALASLLFVFTVALNTLGPIARQSLASAPAYGFGMGGGVGGGPAESLPAEAGPAEPPAAAEPAPTMEALMAAPEAPMQEAPAGDAFAKTAPPAEAPAADVQRGAPAPIPALWIMLLAVAGVLLIGLSVYIDRMTRRKFRSRVMEK